MSLLQKLLSFLRPRRWPEFVLTSNNASHDAHPLRDHFHELHPASVGSMSHWANYDYRYLGGDRFIGSDPFSKRLAANKLLKSELHFKYQHMAHPNGYVRARALELTNEPLPSPFAVAMVVWRMNDWVEPVRQEAARCARRCLPKTDHATIAKAIAQLVVPAQSWGRWGSDALFQEILGSVPEIGTAVAREIAGMTTGPAPRALRFLMKTNMLDEWLPMLLRHAVQPGVRAVAADALITGKSRWVSGRRKIWIDKPNFKFTYAAEFSERPLLLKGEPRVVFAEALQDRAVAVRRAALKAGIASTSDFNELTMMAKPLIEDPSPSIRERVEWILRKAGEE